MRNYRFNLDAVLVPDEMWDFEICEFEDSVGNNNLNGKISNKELTLCEFYSRAKLKDINAPIGSLNCLINTFI